MNRRLLTKAIALMTIAALAACGGSGTNAVPNTPGGGGHGGPLTARIVGVGDSLTAGFQSDGLLGETGFMDPLNPTIPVHPGQENGFWALLDEQASGQPIPTAIAHMYDPAVSPLPLVAKPGLNNQIVPGLTTPIGFEKQGNACTDYGGFNAAGYTLAGNRRTRMNPGSTSIRNVAVPGITLHEAVTLSQPQSMTCKPLSGIQGLLQQVVDGESSTYWPVLGNFASMGNKLTMVSAAASLRPTLATVWLGANDVLKYMGSGGRFAGGDRNAGQASADIVAAVGTLKAAGAKVVVANLPNVLQSPYFMRVTIPNNTQKACVVQIRTYSACVIGNITGGPSSDPYQTGIAWTNAVAAAYHLATPSGCTPATTTNPCGYLTLQGTLLVLQFCAAPSHNCGPSGKLPDLDNGKPGSGLGTYYITPTFAAKIQALNDAINTGIDQAAQQTGSPLVDVHAILEGIASGNPSNPYFQQATSIGTASSPCCTLAYALTNIPGGGLSSFDGLHPSNTGYALIAYAFIGVIDKAFGAKIPEVDVRGVYNGTRCSNSEQCFPDPYAPPYAGMARTR
jgi:lysophospholipase L1-like esterase